MVHKGSTGSNYAGCQHKPSVEGNPQFSPRPEPILGSPVHHGGIRKSSSFPGLRKERRISSALLSPNLSFRYHPLPSLCLGEWGGEPFLRSNPKPSAPCFPPALSITRPVRDIKQKWCWGRKNFLLPLVHPGPGDSGSLERVITLEWRSGSGFCTCNRWGHYCSAVHF